MKLIQEIGFWFLPLQRGSTKLNHQQRLFKWYNVPFMSLEHKQVI